LPASTRLAFRITYNLIAGTLGLYVTCAHGVRHTESLEGSR
jgi:hypothetical protein